MELTTAKHVGQRLAITSAVIGLILAYVIFGWMLYSWDTPLVKSIFWIFDAGILINLFVGAIGLLVMAYWFGQRAGVEILIKKKNEFLTGVKYGLLTLITGSLIGSSVGFVQEGIDNIGSSDNPFIDYYVKPMYWIMLHGTLPAIIVGLWFGRKIKKNGVKLDEGRF